MFPPPDKANILQFVNKIGFDIGDNMLQNIELQRQKTFDFLPELVMFMASYVVKKTFTRYTRAPRHMNDNICFFFVNMFDEEVNGNIKARHQKERAYVHVYPSGHSHMSTFKKNLHINTVAVIVSADYLKSFLNQDAHQFGFLFDKENNFLIEEIMTDEILCTVNDIVKRVEPEALKGYHYKLKAMELLYYLFRSLNNRGKSVHQKLSEMDIKSIYKVRDKLLSSLSKPSSISELKQIAGMNELKMRKLFTQIFGTGIYDYYQHLRMIEAARLLREKRLSVTEVGYEMGFENLSHFTRVFEKHIGKKPKKYSSEC